MWLICTLLNHSVIYLFIYTMYCLKTNYNKLLQILINFNKLYISILNILSFLKDYLN
jgi:hypothetical protein